MASELEAIELRDDESSLKTAGHVPMEIDMIVAERPLHGPVRFCAMINQARPTLEGEGCAAESRSSTCGTRIAENSFCLVHPLIFT